MEHDLPDASSAMCPTRLHAGISLRTLKVGGGGGGEKERDRETESQREREREREREKREIERERGRGIQHHKTNSLLWGQI